MNPLHGLPGLHLRLGLRRSLTSLHPSVGVWEGENLCNAVRAAIGAWLCGDPSRYPIRLRKQRKPETSARLRVPPSLQRFCTIDAMAHFRSAHNNGKTMHDGADWQPCIGFVRNHGRYISFLVVFHN